MNTYHRAVSSVSSTPQTEVPVGKENDMKHNNAGGVSFVITPLQQFRRFLILGTEGGTYYQGESKLTADNLRNIVKIFSTETGVGAVKMLAEVSDQGLAPKVSPTLFALALAFASKSLAVKREAQKVFSVVVRTHSHLLEFVSYVDELRGWGRLLKETVGHWYTYKGSNTTAFQTLKFRNRSGWTTKDVLRMAHPKPVSEEQQSLFKYLVGKDVEESKLPELVRVFEATNSDECSVNEVVSLIKKYNLPREMISTTKLNEPAVWEALLESMPVTALVRNLGKMASIGLLDPFSQSTNKVVSYLEDVEYLQKGRMHPFNMLVALSVYKYGRGVKGSLTWSPNSKIVDALDAAFYSCFKNIEPSNKNTMLALDVSASMAWSKINGSFITAREGSAAMAMATAKVEPNYMVVGFCDTLKELTISPRQRLDDVVQIITNLKFGLTDCALPMLYALKNKIPIETFVVYTDNETWYGNIHPFQALKQYRQKMGIDAKLVVVGMTTTNFSIADPSDAGMLDVVGFDASAPSIISNFSSGEI